jgi:hypothetical protein
LREAFRKLFDYNSPDNAYHRELGAKVLQLPKVKQDGITNEVKAIPSGTKGYYRMVGDIWRKALGVEEETKPTIRKAMPGWRR